MAPDYRLLKKASVYLLSWTMVSLLVAGLDRIKLYFGGDELELGRLKVCVDIGLGKVFCWLLIGFQICFKNLIIVWMKRDHPDRQCPSRIHMEVRLASGRSSLMRRSEPLELERITFEA